MTDAPEVRRTAKLGCQHCGREILDLEALTIRADAVIVVKNCRETGKVEHLRRWLGSHGLWGVLVIDMAGDQDLAQLPADAMERAGWVRKMAKARTGSGRATNQA